MNGLLLFLTITAAAGALSITATVYAFWRAFRRPPEGVVEHGHEARKAGERRIVCAGDSLTHATVSYDYCQVLRERLGAHVRIFNAGVNGDLAYNLAERLPSIVACDPDDVVVLIGTNDICGEQTASVAQRQIREKNLPEPAGRAFFERELHRLLDGLQAQTRARIVVVTPPLLGEDLAHPVHALLHAYAQKITEIAGERALPVIAFHDAMENALQTSGHVQRRGFHPGFTEVMWMALVPFQRYLFGMSYDQISHRRGLWGSADLIHLNETSGTILADLLEAKLRENN
jgi:lysophospholipase L1-like esterase